MTKESGRNTYKIYVGNLAPHTSDNDLRLVFGQYGTVVEAVALASKGFGFVHMTSEEDGVRAMKSLYKYQLNGKEMVVQPAINPKKAQGPYGSRRATIGKGVSTLDDFEDFSEYDQYLDQEIANCISSDSPPSQSSSGYNSYPSHNVNHHLPNYGSGVVNGRPVNSAHHFPVSQDTQRNNTYVNNSSIGNFVNGISNLPPQNNGLVNNGSLNNQAVFGGGNHNSAVVRSPSVWNTDTVPSSNNSLAQLNNIQGNSSLLNFNNSNSIQPAVSDQLMVNQGKPVHQGSNFNINPLGDNSATGNKLALLSRQMNQLQITLQNNPNNLQVIGTINKLQQDIIMTQSQHSLQGQLAKEQAKLQQESMQRMLVQQQMQREQEMQNQFLNQNNNVSTSIHPQMSLANNNPVTSGPVMSSANSVVSSNFSNGNMSRVNSTNGGGSLMCRLCNEPFNMEGRIPKILGCTHTFCLLCLHVRSSPNTNLLCPEQCGVSTPLSSSGVAGLTTNHAILSGANNSSPMHSYNNNLQQKTESMNSANSVEVCASCTGTLQDQPLSLCREEGHTLVRAHDAIQLIHSKLKPLMGDTLAMLKEAMHLRAGIKDRAHWALASLTKFMEELKAKRLRDDAEDNMLISMFTELSRVVEQLDSQSYPDLIRTYHMIDKCSKDVKVQYSQCWTASSLNEAVKSVMLDIHPKALPKIYKMGLKRDEVFEMERSLQSHAQEGNYANVLMQYMVSDLLSSRVHTNRLIVDSINNNEFNSEANDLMSRSASSVSPPSTVSEAGLLQSSCDIVNGVYRSLTTSSSATPDMAAMNGHSMDHLGNMDNLDINYVIQTTEAIEAENRALSKTEIMPFPDHSASLGLSNICHMASADNHIEPVDLEKSLLEGSACIDPEPTKVESSAPSPNSSNSITPPIVGNGARASVDSSAASSDSGIASCGKSFSYLDAAKKPAKPTPEPAPKVEVARLPIQIKQVKTPHCWMKVTVDGESIGRIVFQLRPDKAPKMCENFLGLCTGKPGYGYKGTHFFKNGDGFLAGGDVEYDDGSGGFSIYGKKKFEADLCPLKDEVGMIRFKGNGTSDAGRGMVGSQFMVWYAEREFKKFSYSLVFGRVVDGLDVVKKAANINLQKCDVMIEDCGGIM